jgi:hypothetical protein
MLREYITLDNLGIPKDLYEMVRKGGITSEQCDTIRLLTAYIFLEEGVDLEIKQDHSNCAAYIKYNGTMISKLIEGRNGMPLHEGYRAVPSSLIGLTHAWKYDYSDPSDTIKFRDRS